jgi:hypothetical protein
MLCVFGKQRILLRPWWCSIPQMHRISSSLEPVGHCHSVTSSLPPLDSCMTRRLCTSSRQCSRLCQPAPASSLTRHCVEFRKRGGVSPACCGLLSFAGTHCRRAYGEGRASSLAYEETYHEIVQCNSPTRAPYATSTHRKKVEFLDFGGEHSRAVDRTQLLCTSREPR